MTGTLYVLEARPPTLLALTPVSSSSRWSSRTVLADLGGTPDGIAIDRSARTIYWTNMGDDYGAADGTIECARLDGSQRRILVGGGAIVTPKQLALDEDGGHLYWCDREGMRVMRARLDGSEVVTLVQTGAYPRDVADVPRHCVGIALDRRGGHVYWTQKGNSDAGQGRIFRAGLELPAGATPSTRTDVELLAEHLPEPIDLEIDPEARTLYWTDRGNLVDGNTLNRARLGASGLADRAVLARGLEEGIGLALDLAGRRAFVSDLGGKIRSVDLAGGEPSTVFTCGPVTGIAFVPGTAS